MKPKLLCVVLSLGFLTPLCAEESLEDPIEVRKSSHPISKAEMRILVTADGTVIELPSNADGIVQIEAVESVDHGEKLEFLGRVSVTIFVEEKKILSLTTDSATVMVKPEGLDVATSV